jgi:hypothetical protein
VSCSRLERSATPGTGDGERDSRRLDIREEPFTIGAVAGAGELLVAVITRIDRLSSDRKSGFGQLDVVFGERHENANTR